MYIVSPAEKLKLLRLRRGWTQENLVEQIKIAAPELNVYQVLISRYETNSEEPSPELKQILNEVLEENIWE